MRQQCVQLNITLPASPAAKHDHVTKFYLIRYKLKSVCGFQIDSLKVGEPFYLFSLFLPVVWNEVIVAELKHHLRFRGDVRMKASWLR